MNHSLSTQKVLQYINQARKDPKSIIPHIEKTMAKFKDDTNYEIAPNFYMTTREGKKAWKQAIQFLKTQKPLQPLSLNQGLMKAAQTHAADLGENNQMGHVGSTGSSMQQRINHFCIYSNGNIGQNVAQQIKQKGRNHELQSIVSLIIDDGVKNRGHRNSIFSSSYRYLGIGISQTKRHYLIVIDYASQNLELRTNKPQSKNIQKVEKPNDRKKQEVINQYKNSKSHQSQFQQMFEKMSFPQKKDAINKIVNQKPKQSCSKKQIVGKSSSSKTSTKNGKTVQIKTVTIKYSDGSSETTTQEIVS